MRGRRGAALCATAAAAAAAPNASRPLRALPEIDCRPEPPTGTPTGPPSGCQTRAGPADQSRATYEQWSAGLQDWASSVRADFRAGGYDFDAAYGDPALAWARRAFVLPQAMIHDRYLYDREAHRWTVDRFLDDLEARYGGVHGVLLWPFYTNGGIDDRNQFDFLTSLPGGMPATRGMVADFHRRGVKVLWPYFPWDIGTRDTHRPHYADLVDLLKEAGMDGLNGDTVNGLNVSWWDYSVAQQHPVVLEPQSMTSNSGGTYPDWDPGFKNLAWNVASWGEWWGGMNGEGAPHAPVVSSYKYLDTRHMVHITARYATNRTNDLHTAWFNGAGYNPWESVWCQWNALTPRDAQALKRLSPLYNEFGALLQGADFVPHAPVSLLPGVFAAEFGDAERRLWTVVNRAGRDVSGELLELPCAPGARFYDVYRGEELAACRGRRAAAVALRIERAGFGAVLRSAEAPDAAFLSRMRDATREPLDMYSDEWRPVGQVLVAQQATRRRPARRGMVTVPATRYHFVADGNQGGGGPIPDSEDVQMPWEAHPQQHHDHVLDLSAFAVDATPVTNAEYAAFLAESGWRPAEPDAWLKGWDHSGRRAPAPPAGGGRRPAVWLSRADAAAYCRHHGKRLPEVWEWQLAAQGGDGRRYPWGDDACPSCHPPPSDARELPPAADVDAHPSGASPFGALDMWGNTFEWTSEFADAADPAHHGHTGHSSRALLKGGSRWRPSGSAWYFPAPAGLQEHNVLLLHSDAMDRSGNIGFRCAADL